MKVRRCTKCGMSELEVPFYASSNTSYCAKDFAAYERERYRKSINGLPRRYRRRGDVKQPVPTPMGRAGPAG
jgi:hypothetical protein